MSKPPELQHDLERSLPAIASISTSLSHSQAFSPYGFFSPEKRKAISDVRRTFCLFVTFDLLFISLLWIIELNVSGGQKKKHARSFSSPPVQPDPHGSLSQSLSPRFFKLQPGSVPAPGPCFGCPGSLTASRGGFCAAL